MRIAILIPSFLPKLGGAQVFGDNIAAQLTRRGHTVDLYTHNPTKYLRKSLPYRLRGLPPYFFAFVKHIPLIGRGLGTFYLLILQKVLRYDIWLSIMSYPSGYAVAGLQGRVPIVLRCSGEDIQKDSSLNYGIRINAKLEEKVKKTLLAHDRLIALTESVREEFHALGIEEDRIETIPNGVDLARFTPVFDKKQLLTSLGWPHDRPIVLTVGRNHPKKGFDFIPVIARRLVENGINFCWYVVGHESSKLKPAIEENNVDKWVKCIEQVGMSREDRDITVPPDELVQMYQAADVFAFPSLLETFGMVLIEAMAAGLAVVSTNAPGCRDVVKPGINGLQAIAGDVDSFVKELKKPLTNTKLRNELGKRGREFAKDYDWHIVGYKYEKLFLELCKNF